MEKPCLNDESVYPDDYVLSRHLGEVKSIWDSFIKFINKNYPSYTGEWRYYRDGKSWLYKMTNKKKTICWISVYENKFKTTFYFPDKAEDLISGSNLAREYIDQFIHGKRYGKIRGITVDITTSSDLEAVKTLIEIKEQLK
ncbi:DUF3788 family protein [candidate division KSB1 bacterium]|nr:DUF3788 family protein [candidate division KSB1 bacterium]